MRERDQLMERLPQGLVVQHLGDRTLRLLSVED